MEWRRPGGEQALHGDSTRRDRQSAAGKVLIVLPVFAIALAGPAHARAFGPAWNTPTAARTSTAAMHSGLPAATDGELSSIWARGLPERLLAGKSVYFADGNAVEALGSMAALLNPPPEFTDGNVTFRNVRFDPGNLSTVVDSSGAALVRLSTYIGDAHFDNARTDGSHGPRIGSVSVHGIDLRGTIIRIERIR